VTPRSLLPHIAARYEKGGGKTVRSPLVYRGEKGKGKEEGGNPDEEEEPLEEKKKKRGEKRDSFPFPSKKKIPSGNYPVCRTLYEGKNRGRHEEKEDEWRRLFPPLSYSRTKKKRTNKAIPSREKKEEWVAERAGAFQTQYILEGKQNYESPIRRKTRFDEKKERGLSCSVY